MQISDIDKNSLAGKDGHIQVRDQLLLLNGKTLEDRTPHDARVMLRTSREQLVLVLARSSGETRPTEQNHPRAQETGRVRQDHVKGEGKDLISADPPPRVSPEKASSPSPERGTVRPRALRSSVSPEKPAGKTKLSHSHQGSLRSWNLFYEDFQMYVLLGQVVCNGIPNMISLNRIYSMSQQHDSSSSNLTMIFFDVFAVPEVQRDPSTMDTIEVTMSKGVTGLGFCLEGGTGSPLGDKPILIKRLFKGARQKSSSFFCQKCLGDFFISN